MDKQTPCTLVAFSLYSTDIMKVTVLQEDFAKALSLSLHFTSPKVQLPILANVALIAEKNNLKICCTNLEISICISIGGEVEEEGSITVPSRVLTDIIVNLTKGKILIESKDEKITLTAKDFSANLLGVSANDFPIIPQALNDNSLSVPLRDLINALSLILPAVSFDESRPILTGVLFIFKKDVLSFVATDGFRLSQKSIPVKTTKEERMVVPKGILQEIVRLKDEGEVFELSPETQENQLVAKCGKSILSSRLIDGAFPDYERIIPKETSINIILERQDFLKAIKIASVFAKDSANVIKIKIGKAVLEIFAESPQKGKSSTTIEAKVTRTEIPERPKEAEGEEEITIAFNCKFLEDFVMSSHGEEIEISCNDSSTPTIFKDPEDSDFLHIIMPIKLQ